MKLIRLTSNNPTAYFNNTLNQDIILEPFTQIALQSLCLQVDTNELIIDASNNGMFFKMLPTGDIHEVFFNFGKYNQLNIDELFTDMTLQLNKSLTSNISSEIGFEWKVELNEYTKKVGFLVHKGETQNFTKFATDTNLGSSKVQYTSSALRRTDQVINNQSFIFSEIPMAKGAGNFRVRTLEFGQCFIGLTTKPIDPTATEVPYEIIKYGIELTTNGLGESIYKQILNGVVSNPSDSYEYEPKDTMVIGFEKGQIVLSIYAKNSTDQYIMESFDYDNTTPLFPVVVLRGPTLRIDSVYSTPSPHYNITSVKTGVQEKEYNDIDTNGLYDPPKPSTTKTGKYIEFKDIRLALSLGFKGTRDPSANYQTEYNGNFLAKDIFVIGALNQSYSVQMLNLNIPSSYDTLTQQRNNTLATINTSVQDNSRLTYECNFPIWLDLNNAQPITQRNWVCRVLFENNQEIPTIGFSQMTLLTKNREEK